MSKKGDLPVDPKNPATPPADPPKADPPAGDPPAGDPPADPPAKQEKTYTKAELEAATKKAAADALKKANDEKDLTELEKLQKENAELRDANRLRDAKESVVDALKKAGARSPELIWKALQGEIEFDDKGGLKNLDSLVTNYKTDFADQFGEPKPDQTIDAGAGQGGQPGTKLTEEAIKKMTPDQINENWAEVSKVLADAK